MPTIPTPLENDFNAKCKVDIKFYKVNEWSEGPKIFLSLFLTIFKESKSPRHPNFGKSLSLLFFIPSSAFLGFQTHLTKIVKIEQVLGFYRWKSEFSFLYSLLLLDLILRL